MIWLLALQLAIGPTQHYENAKQDFAERKFSEAVSEVNAALHENPYMVPALVLKARLATFAHRPDVAKSCLITAITADPTSEEAQFYLGVFYYMQNDFKLAISPLQTAQTLSPKSPLPVFYLAMTHEALGDESQGVGTLPAGRGSLSDRNRRKARRFSSHTGGSCFHWAGPRRVLKKIDGPLRRTPSPAMRTMNWQRDWTMREISRMPHVEGERALTLPELGTSDAQIHFLLANLYRKLNQPDLAKAHLEKFQAAPQTTSR